MQPESGFPVLKTQRLLLRELVDCDAERILEIHGNAEAMRFIGTESISTIEEAQQPGVRVDSQRQVASVFLRPMWS
jgi:ribosomal-protein-alanine N-acetyltransferase